MVTSPRLGQQPWLIAWTLVALMLMTSTIGPFDRSSVLANGATRELFKNERAGPYELQVGILPGRPKVGNLHLSILITDAESRGAVTNATVSVAVEGPEASTSIGPVPARNTFQNPRFYDVDLLLDAEGSWLLNMKIDGDQGLADLEFPFEVTSSGGVSLALVAAVTIACLAVSIWGWDRIKGRRRRNKRKM